MQVIASFISNTEREQRVSPEVLLMCSAHTVHALTFSTWRWQNLWESTVEVETKEQEHESLHLREEVTIMSSSFMVTFYWPQSQHLLTSTTWRLILRTCPIFTQGHWSGRHFNVFPSDFLLALCCSRACICIQCPASSVSVQAEVPVPLFRVAPSPRFCWSPTLATSRETV